MLGIIDDGQFDDLTKLHICNWQNDLLFCLKFDMLSIHQSKTLLIMVRYYIINILFIAVLGYHDMWLGQEGMVIIICKHEFCVLPVLIRNIYLFKYEVFSSVGINL